MKIFKFIRRGWIGAGTHGRNVGSRPLSLLCDSDGSRSRYFLSPSVGGSAFPIQQRSYGRSVPTQNAGGVKKVRDSAEVTSSLEEKDYHEIAENTFDVILDYLNALDMSEDPLLADCDISYSMGVMNIKLGGSMGTWVLNKQTPNRQIWWSSPISGPRRYELIDESSATISAMKDGEMDDIALVNQWQCTKEKNEKDNLMNVLRKEMLEVTKIDIFEEH
jgi:frataxin